VDPNLEAQRARQRENLCAIPVEHRGRQGFVPRCDVNGQAVTVESALRDLAESFVEDDAEMAEVLAELRRRHARGSSSRPSSRARAQASLPTTPPPTRSRACCKLAAIADKEVPIDGAAGVHLRTYATLLGWADAVAAATAPLC
jgi:hypothetical protein